MSVRVRDARREDLPRLPEVERSAAEAFRGMTDVPFEVITAIGPGETYAPHMAEGTLWVAEMEGELVGFLAARRHGSRLHIDEVDVAHGQQGQGVGRRLIETAIAHAQEQRLGEVTLTTFRTIPWNAPYYARFGFRALDPEETSPELAELIRAENAKGLNDRCAMRLELQRNGGA
jgi:GNAT superfamily N-acetyltransferase